jgi:hypothetical protein
LKTLANRNQCNRPNRHWSDHCVWCGRERDPTTPGNNGPAPPLYPCVNKVSLYTLKEIASPNLAQTLDPQFNASPEELLNDISAHNLSSLTEVDTPSPVNCPSGADIPIESIEVDSPEPKAKASRKKMVLKFKRNAMDAAQPGPNLGNDNCNVQSRTDPSNSREISTTQGHLDAPQGRMEYENSTNPHEPSATIVSSPALKDNATNHPIAEGKTPLTYPKIKLKLTTRKSKTKATANLEEQTENGHPQTRGKLVSRALPSKEKRREPPRDVVADVIRQPKAEAAHVSALLRNQTDNCPKTSEKSILPPPHPRKRRASSVKNVQGMEAEAENTIIAHEAPTSDTIHIASSNNPHPQTGWKTTLPPPHPRKRRASSVENVQGMEAEVENIIIAHEAPTSDTIHIASSSNPHPQTGGKTTLPPPPKRARVSRKRKPKPATTVRTTARRATATANKAFTPAPRQRVASEQPQLGWKTLLFAPPKKQVSNSQQAAATPTSTENNAITPPLVGPLVSPRPTTGGKQVLPPPIKKRRVSARKRKSNFMAEMGDA